jgi:hypothetical protein
MTKKGQGYVIRLVDAALEKSRWNLPRRKSTLVASKNSAGSNIVRAILDTGNLGCI